MTTTNILEKRKKNLDQRKNRLKQLEVSLNAQGRKRRTRRLIEIGGLAAKANLEDWNSNALLGAFLSLKEKESDKKEWEGYTKIEELKSLLAPHGASITELDAGSEK